mgnify:CR=1 FL=1
MNFDIKEDIIVSNLQDNTVSVLLNSDSGFKTTNYDVGLNPNSVAVSDINGDGYLDILTLNSGSNDVSILLGKGDGTFNNALTYKLPTSYQIMGDLKISSTSAPNTFSVGDINNDGTPDLVIGYLNGAVLIIPFGYDIPKKPTVKQTSNLNTLNIAGIENGGVVKIYDGNNEITSNFITDGNGNYTAILNAFDGSKKFNISATVTDTAGNISAPSDLIQITLDTTPPSAPIINSNNGSTNSSKPVIKGLAEPNSIITIFDGLSKIGSTVTLSSGDWSFQPQNDLSKSGHIFTATATDKFGNVSSSSEINYLTTGYTNKNIILNKLKLF